MNKRKISIILNIILVILELIGIFIVFKLSGLSSIVYYTLDSNILSLISSIIYLSFIINNKKVPKIVSLLKYISVVCLTITFLVVVLILAPMYEFNYYWLLIKDASFFVHLSCPITALVSFLFFEKHDLKDKFDKYRGFYFTILYALIIVPLNILSIVEGPYPFLYVKKNSLFVSIIWAFVILGFSFLISYIVLKLKNKIWSKK